LPGKRSLKRSNPREALNSFQEAQKLTDTWLGHFDLGRAYLDAGFSPKPLRNSMSA